LRFKNSDHFIKKSSLSFSELFFCYMKHYNFIIENIEDIKCINIFWTDISGLDFNIDLFQKKKNSRLILKYLFKIALKYIMLLFSFSSYRYINNYSDLHLYKQIVRTENIKYSFFGRLYLILLIRSDIIFNRCKYITVLNKRILMYEEMKHIRM